jgi:taurine dioxygenase
MRLKTRSLMPNFGVEVVDIDLTQEIDDDVFEEIMALYYEHSALLFRKQNLEPRHQAALAHRFGRPKIENRKQYNLKDHPEVSTIGNLKDSTGKPEAFFVRGGFGWHTDGSAACHVDAATFLYAIQVPKIGGETLLCSTATAYEKIPDTLRQRLKGLRMLCSFHAHNDPLYESDPEAFIPLSPKERDALPPVWHDITQKHPVSGRDVLYMSFDPLEFNNIDIETGKSWLKDVLKVATADDLVYTHQYQPGDLLIWDNHSMLHSGTPTKSYEDDDVRLLHRSFVYTWPTERPLLNLDELNRIFS